MTNACIAAAKCVAIVLTLAAPACGSATERSPDASIASRAPGAEVRSQEHSHPPATSETPAGIAEHSTQPPEVTRQPSPETPADSPTRVRVETESSAPTRHEPERTTIAVGSDLNASYGSVLDDDHDPATIRTAVAAIIDSNPDIMYLTGDMIAGQTRDVTTDHLGRMWAGFDRNVLQPLLAAGIPVAFTFGNHDAALQADRDAAFRFWAPRKASLGLEFVDDTDFPFNYSFRLGHTVFISIDGTTTGPLSSEQHAWMRTQFSEHGADADARVILTHVPQRAFTGQERKRGEVLNDPELDRIAEQCDVTLFSQGHHHVGWAGILQSDIEDGDGATVHQGSPALEEPRVHTSGAPSEAGWTFIVLQGQSVEVTFLGGPDMNTPHDMTRTPETSNGMIRLDLLEGGSESIFAPRRDVADFRARCEG